MTINYEIVNIIAVAAFIISIAWIGKLNIIKTILAIMTAAYLIIPPSTIYFIILSSISLLQVWYLISKGRNTSSYKYLIYSFVFIFMNIPTVSIYYRSLLILIFLIKTLIGSYKDEVADSFMFVLNAAMITGMVLNIQPFNQTSIISTVLFCTIMLSLLRYLFDKSVKTPMYILPLFIIASVSSGSIVIILSAIYTFLAAVIYKEKVGLSFLCLFSIPFIDNSTVYITIKNVISGLVLLDQGYALWSIIALGAIAVMKFYEQEMVTSIKVIKLHHVIEVVAAIGISVGFSFSNYGLSNPVPLFCIIPLVIIEARYIHVINRVPLAFILTLIERTLNKGYQYKKETTRAVYIKSQYSIRVILRNPFIFPKILMLGARRYYLKSIIYITKYTRRLLSLSAELIEKKIIKKVGLEELIAIISAITILLIYFLGDK